MFEVSLLEKNDYSFSEPKPQNYITKSGVI
jgi:hypothetical protein